MVVKFGRKIDSIIIHCSASSSPFHDNVETIERWHKDRGFKQIGYHWVITRDGKLHQGRPEQVVGAHVEGHNKTSLGICLTGDKEFTPEQMETLKLWVKHTMKRYSIAGEKVFGHRDFNKHKTCPNFEVKEVLKDILVSNDTKI